jgi:fructokinase
MAASTVRLGVDLGGTKIEVAVFRTSGASDAPEDMARLRVPTDRDRGYEHIVRTVAGAIAEGVRLAGLTTRPTIGVGMPGSATRAGLVKNSNTICLNGRPFFSDLRAAVGDPDIRFANDANCFTLAEARFGAARNARVVFGVILGTGVGGGVVFRSATGALEAWEGADGIAGEWGHVTLDPDNGPACYCGRRGCIEQYLSGPAIERAHVARGGDDVRVAEVARRARLPGGGDAIAKATLDRTIEIFGRSLATVINVLDPDVVVLGGGVSNLDALYDEGVAAVERWVFNPKVDRQTADHQTADRATAEDQTGLAETDLRTRIVRHALGDSAGVCGAALLHG